LTSSSNETNTDKNKENDQNNNDVSEINWASPEYTFPLLMKVMNIDAFFHPIISGLVISVGGLTESVTKHSTKSFLDYFRALQKGNLIVRISKIGKGKSQVKSHCNSSQMSIVKCRMTFSYESLIFCSTINFFTLSFYI
jgi:hypothetical protein